MQIIIDQLLTNYQKFGESGDLILILPGWKRNSIEWQNVAKALAQNQRIIILDLPGFGLSQKPKSDWDIFEYAQFVKNFLKKINIKKCLLIGHSFGGRIGIILASEDKLIDQLILVDAAGIEEKGAVLKIKLILAKILKPLIPAKIRAKILQGDYQDSGELRQIFKKVTSQNLGHLLPKIAIPTTIIWGENDYILPLAHGKIFRSKIKDSKLRIIWGAGHDPHLEKPEQFKEILNEALTPN